MPPKTKKRFYLPYSYPFNPNHEPAFEDFGTNLTVAGMVFQGMGAQVILMSPGLEFDPNFTVDTPSLEDWGTIIRQTDDPEIFVGEVGGVNKVLHRKFRYSISGEVQQRIWVRDGFMCRYCAAPMGKVLMTIDHFVPLELGGVNDESNYITACRKCNKHKGDMSPEEFCKLKKIDFSAIQEYLRRRTANS